jgi:2-C-methyl-D-erythritol 4-phosphate cytidylyltransferase / 2-C-methyl-D-erythritol 2,4-cyclodiphosphate synthase
MSKGKVAAIIVAAGRGERAGREDGPKQYRRIGGKAVLRHTIERFCKHDEIDLTCVAIHPDDHDLFERAMSGYDAPVILVDGGSSRQASTLRALEAIETHGCEIVLIQDGVRPFADKDLISRVINAARAGTGALPALAVSDTLKRGKDGMVVTTVARQDLYAAQTPQGFPFASILAAHRQAAYECRDDFTDDAAIAEWAGLPVALVPGSPDNTKLTWPRDIAMADRRFLHDMTKFPDIRTGNGYDVHAFGPGDRVFLCGVEIAHDRTLSGHSDADVGLHALTDALLATQGAGDIGTHFPPSDPQWKGAASRIFVAEATRIVRKAGGRIANADVTLICEEPKIGPHRPAMVAAMADMLAIDPQRVSVKATTNERLGFLGRGEGIAAIATVSVIYPGEVTE